MVVLDTHIWIWLADQREESLTSAQRAAVRREQASEAADSGLGLSVFSCWEVAKKVEVGKLVLSLPVEEWFARALAYPGLRVLDLTYEIALASTRLPEGLATRDPADQLIVATARVWGAELLTQDEHIRAYPHVRTI